MTYALCRFALVTNQPYGSLVDLDLRTLLTMFQAHADIVDEERR